MSLRHASLAAFVSLSFALTSAACGGSSNDDGDQTKGNSGGSGGAASASVSASSSGGAASTSSASQSSSSASASSSSSGGFMTAAHEANPKVDDLGGAVLMQPKVMAIEYASDAMTSMVDDFLPKMAASTYWPATTKEYGVGALTATAPIHRTDAPPTGTVSTSTLLGDLDTNTSGATPAWGAPDPSTIYLFVLPKGAKVDDGGVCCSDFDGFHDETKLKTSGVTVPYAMVCQCPGFDGPQIDDQGQLTVVISHELIEAATDPLPETSPAYAQTDADHLAWVLLSGGELADMCALSIDSYYRPADLDYVVQRSWSNAAAAAGTNPCVPADKSEPYFNSVPKLDDMLKLMGYPTKGVTIPVGSSKAVELDLFSDAPTSGPWKVSAYDYASFEGGSPELNFSFDKTSGENGDKIMMTIQVVKQDPEFGAEPFIIYSDGPNGEENVWMGLVGN